ncbi:MAG TPA: NAD(+)--dinitrogen-reductase ADP-D-ribosyltransferase [Azospira sp.]|nr:NAD(+)--dinitrogen-reductase ADP-D-ribosyltransferase [Azospira sp.]
MDVAYLPGMKPAALPAPAAPLPLGHSTNLVGVPSGLLASAAFNDHPLRLHISGVRETSPALFRMLADATCAEEAVDAFQKYMAAVFGVNEGGERRDRPDGGAPGGRRLFRSSYRRLLQGWGFDANNPEGAVLKGWVESRFGLLPTFHKAPLGRYPSRAWMTYVEEKMSARFHNNSIQLQLDLLYEYCQWMLARYTFPSRRHLTLYRGVNDLSEHHVVATLGKREAIVRQNNLISFTDDREVADQFGDTILEVQVPLVKILFFNGLLPGSVLKGEGEYLVIGGDYRVQMAYY